MTAAFVQATNGANAGPVASQATGAFVSNTVVGNSILVAVWWDHDPTTTLVSVTDIKGNVYAPVGTVFTSINDQSVHLYYSLNIGTAGAAHTVTANFSSGNATAVRVVAHEVSGLLTSGALDQSTKNQDATALPTAAALLPTTNGQYWFAAVMNDAGTGDTFSQGSGFTEPANSTASAGAGEAMAEYMVQTVAASVAATWVRSIAGHNVWAVATFKAVADAAPATLMGQICI